MPLYDFACDACGHEFEAQAPTGETAACPSCDAGSAETRRLWRPIAPPAKLGLRGRAARESNARRAEREAKRHQK
jgi:putative FmdB family regulatory protein